jgi:hypothetical protein
MAACGVDLDGCGVEHLKKAESIIFVVEEQVCESFNLFLELRTFVA